MLFIGLDRPPVKNGLEDLAGVNRSNLMFCIYRILAVVKRCTIPEDPDRAARGGFVAALSESGNPVYRNPAAMHVIPVLPIFFAFLRAYNGLFSPAALNLLPEEYKNVHGLLESERINLMGIINSSKDSDNSSIDLDQHVAPSTRMQSFLATIHDYSYHLLGNACHTIGRDFYQLPGLAQALLDSVFSNLEVSRFNYNLYLIVFIFFLFLNIIINNNLNFFINSHKFLSYLQLIPDHRLRPIIRVFMKPFVFSCPPAFYESVLVPILARVSTHSKL